MIAGCAPHLMARAEYIGSSWRPNISTLALELPNFIRECQSRLSPGSRDSNTMTSGLCILSGRAASTAFAASTMPPCAFEAPANDARDRMTGRQTYPIAKHGEPVEFGYQSQDGFRSSVASTAIPEPADGSLAWAMRAVKFVAQSSRCI
jgi:hypothetical protein